MSQRKRRKILYPFLGDALLALLSAVCLAQALGNRRWGGAGSALFLLAVCALCAVYGFLPLLGKRFHVPNWARALKYMAVCTAVVSAAAAPSWLGVCWAGLGLVSLLLIDRAALEDRRLPLFALAPMLLCLAPALAQRRVSGLWLVPLAALSLLLAYWVWRLNDLWGKRDVRAVTKAPPEAEGYTPDGYIKDQDCFSAYTYRTIPASFNSCGCVAAYNLRRFRGEDVRYAEVLGEMDRMHLLRMPGPTMMHVMRRYTRRYLPGGREVTGRSAALAAARESEMGIFRYREEHVPHFVSYIRVGEGRFRFFNVSDEAEDQVFAMEEFVSGHCVEGQIRLLYWAKNS